MTRGSIFFIFLLISSCNLSQYEKPNIILFFYDDLGYGELGVYGQKIIETKNIDKLANNGMGASPWSDLLSSEITDLPEVKYSDLGSIFFTSGTTGLSRV